jgi:hypothetical protein
MLGELLYSELETKKYVVGVENELKSVDLKSEVIFKSSLRTRLKPSPKIDTYLSGTTTAVRLS